MGSVDAVESRSIEALRSLDALLADFNLSRKNGKSIAVVNGSIPSKSSSESEHLNLCMVGALPSLANALAAAQILELRGGPAQEVSVDIARGHNYLDPDVGMTPSLNGQEIPIDVLIGNPFISGIFETKDGRKAVISAVYVDLVYQWLTFLDCSPQEDAVRAAVKVWDSKHLESAAAKVGLPMAIVMDEDEWNRSEHGKHMKALPIVPIKKVGSAPPKPFPPVTPQRPLEGIKVLCLTHAIAGPSSGRTLAEHGASVLQIMFTHGFEHNFVYSNANMGCASARMNLHKRSDVDRLWTLIEEADVWVDSYREGGISKFGFTDEALMTKNPNLVIAHVRCYGTTGPWATKPGFDMQASASSGIMALCGNGARDPRWAPGKVINDYTTGYFCALAIQSALIRRTTEGGAYILSPSLTRTAMAILEHFKSSDSKELQSSTADVLPPREFSAQTPLGYLNSLLPLPQMSVTMPRYDPIVLVPIGSSLPAFEDSENVCLPGESRPLNKHDVVLGLSTSTAKRLMQLRQLGRDSRKIYEP